jgi:WD40 repeat protein
MEHQFEGPKHSALPIFSLPLAATGSVDNKVSIWDIQTHRVRHTLTHEASTLE